MEELVDKPLPDMTEVEREMLSQTLGIIGRLFQKLHESGISYCHWKSSEHLAASMTGDTDLDVLFDKERFKEVERIVHEIGFKHFKSIKQKQYVDIEDYLALDYDSGKVVHLHAHYRLTMGEMYLKSYQPDLEVKLLSTRFLDDTFGIYRITPAFELALLYIRESLKIRNRDVIKLYLFNRANLSENILREYKWLRERVTDQELRAVLSNIFGKSTAIFNIMRGEFDRHTLLRLSPLIKEEFKNERLYSASRATLLRWYRESSVKVRKIARILDKTVPSQRINPRGGLSVAIIGADGSGKSTLVANVTQTFSNKLDTSKIYFGRGDGKRSFSRNLLLNIKYLVYTVKRKKYSLHPKAEKKSGLMTSIYKSIEALLVAQEKRNNLKLMHKARKRGMLVVCDRFPQNQVMGYNDGPLLHSLNNSYNILLKSAARAEAVVYRLAEASPPDVIIKLIAEAEVVEARKPGETPLQVLKAKIEGIKGLTFPRRCNTITIDASLPLEEVLKTVKQKIWEAYP